MDTDHPYRMPELLELQFSESESASRSVSVPFRITTQRGGWSEGTLSVGAQRIDGAWERPTAYLGIAGGPGLSLEQLEEMSAMVRKLFVAYHAKYELGIPVRAEP